MLRSYPHQTPKRLWFLYVNNLPLLRLNGYIFERRRNMREYCFALALVLGCSVSAQEIVVPNFNFDEIYLPGSDAITGSITGFDWTAGVGPDCSIDPECLARGGGYDFSDGTFGTVADISGWVGYDREGWIALGGTYNRDQTTGNYQGAIQASGVDSSYCYLANGGDWGNPAGGLIVSDASLGNVEDGTYTLSMVARGPDGPATPVVLKLLAGGIALTPASSVDPVLTGDFQEFSRTYDSDSLVGFIGEPLTICLGVGRGASGAQTHFDNVSLILDPVSSAPNPPTAVAAAGGIGKVNLTWTAPAGGVTPTGYQVFRGDSKIADVVGVATTTYTDEDTSLVPGTTYCYTVKSVAGGLTSGPSNEACATPVGGKPRFRRGDPNSDGIINITDGIYVLNFLFLGGPAPTCTEAANANDDGSVNITDGIYVLNFLFLGGPAPAAPGASCGSEPEETPSDLGCASYTKC
jgi:hypothetical protein